MSGERTLLRVYMNGEGCVCYSKMLTDLTHKDMAELIVMTDMLHSHLMEEYQETFLEARIMCDEEVGKTRKLIDRTDIPPISESEVE